MNPTKIYETRIRACHFIVLITLFLLTAPFTVAENRDKIDHYAYNQLENNQDVYVSVILNDQNDLPSYERLITASARRAVYKTRKERFIQEEEKIISKLTEDEFRLKKKFSSINGFSGYITRSGLKRLENMPSVKYVEADKPINLTLSESRGKINTLEGWNLGYDGSGETICVVDSGLDQTHPAFGCPGDNCKIIYEEDFYGAGDSDATDYYGHGTHVAGIASSNDDGTTHDGIAPGTRLIVMKACADLTSSCSPIAIGEAVDTCSDISQSNPEYNISIVTISIADHELYTSSDCNPTSNGRGTATEQIKAAAALDLFIDAASSNENYITGISWPACIAEVVSVGAIYKHANDRIWDDPPYGTNRGSNLDLLAPGVDILSARASGTDPGTRPTGCRESTNDDYMYCDGTSMAAPHVAGAAAILQQFSRERLNRDLSPDEILDALSNSGIPFNDTGRSNLIFPIIDIWAAINYLSSINVGDSVSGEVRRNQRWQTNLSIDNTINVLEVILNWNASRNLNLIVVDPNGNPIPANNEQFRETVTVGNPDLGRWTIRVVGGSDIGNGQTVPFRITTRPVPPSPEEVGDNLGGINFTSSNLNYISTCDPQNGFQAVMRGTEANATDTIINITNATIQATDAFLTALTIPDDRIWVTMDTRPGPGFAGRVGDVSRVDDNLAHTQLGQIMFDADIQLKHDHFGQSQSLIEGLVNDWEETVTGDPSRWPGYYARVWISSDSVQVNGTGCEIFITNTTLAVNSVVDAVWVNGGGYETELAQFRTDLENGLASIAADAEVKVNSDPAYEELRRAHASIALAQWYKQQPRESVIYNELIDSYNISDFYVDFDESYYESQAWQHLYTFRYYDNGNYWWDYSVYGGVELTDVESEVVGNLSNHTEELLENASIYSYSQENSIVYYSVLENPNRPDLVPLALGFSSLTPDANEIVNITVVVRNEGPANATSFRIRYMYDYTYSNGYNAQYFIGEEEVANLPANQIVLVSILTNLSLTGDYTLITEIDYTGNVSELNELNNEISGMIRVADPSPTASIVTPSNGNEAYATVLTLLAGVGTDVKDGDLNESLYNWTSDVDGYLGNGSILYVNLSEGDHVIYFTVQDFDNNRDTDQIIISVLASQPPVITLNSPSNNQLYQEGEIVYFDAGVIDHEDGLLTGSSLSWNSSIDGFLGFGNSLRLNSLSVGTHTITLTATDSSDMIATSVINTTVEESTPNVTINAPGNGTEYYYTQANVTFNGTAIDPHEWDLSSQLNWTSSLDDAIGFGPLFSATISQGTHLISSFVMDSFGLTGLDQIYLTVFAPLPPTVSIISPTNNRQIVNGNQFTFRGSSNDPETGALSGDSLVWDSSLDGNVGNGTEFNHTNFTVGVHEITLTAVDGDNQAASVSINITVTSSPPDVIIISPPAGAVYQAGGAVLFNGTAEDYEDGSLSGISLLWTSNRDGAIGTGNSFTLNNLSSGFHVISFNATDGHGVRSEGSVTIPIVGEGNMTFTTLSDGSSIRNLTYSAPGSQAVYLRLPSTATITNAGLNITGYGIE